MSKNSKNTARLKRLQRKRALKASNKATFEERARQGQNSKSKRATAQAKKKEGPRPASHNYDCGNIGCKQCNPN